MGLGAIIMKCKGCSGVGYVAVSAADGKVAVPKRVRTPRPKVVAVSVVDESFAQTEG